MKLTIERIDEIIKEGEKLEGTKLKFAYDKFVKRVTDANKIAQENFKEKLEDIKIDLCSVDEKGNIIHELLGDSLQYKFTKENQKELNKKAREIQIKELEFEFTGLFVCPEGLTREQRDAFSGVLIPEHTEIDNVIDIDMSGTVKSTAIGNISEDLKTKIQDATEQAVKEVLDSAE